MVRTSLELAESAVQTFAKPFGNFFPGYYNLFYFILNLQSDQVKHVAFPTLGRLYNNIMI